MSTNIRAERADIMPREPRCRVCRHPDVRRLVNELLDWRGVPIFLGRGKTHRVTYAEILRILEPINQVRDKRDRISYDSVWVHARRHYDYDIDEIAAHWEARMYRELALRLKGRKPIEQP